MANKRLNEVVYDGKKYRLPFVSKGRRLTPSKKLEIAELVCLIYSNEADSLATCLKKCGIQSRTTWFRWVKEMEQIEQLYNKAQHTHRENLHQIILEETQATILKLVRGEFIKELETVEHIYQVIDGKEVEVGKKVTTREIFVRPSTALLLRILEMGEPEMYCRPVVIAKALAKDNDIGIMDIINNIKIDDSRALDEQPHPLFKTEEEAREWGKTL